MNLGATEALTREQMKKLWEELDVLSLGTPIVKLAQ